MFFVLSKILLFFLKPVTWIIIALLYSRLSKKPLRKRIFFWSAILMLVFFSNQFISNQVMLWWEPEAIPMNQIGVYDVGIVFSGVTKESKGPRDRVYFADGADRITHTLQLYNERKLKHIIVSGGLGLQQQSNSTGAERLRSFLLMAGVPDSVITVEPDAVNTHENAEKSAEILNRDFPNQKYLLITSAFHMKRSAMCLRKQGIEFDEFPAGFYTGEPTLHFDDLFIPKAESVLKWELLIKEWVGIATYKVMGYL